ncbi:hypothetical protein B0H19DRAFT_1300307 [Mycena capillaripes]|nr:hypothetical protein B0H19DRAFT_1300307 [Mycena capillaripes]
MILPRDNSNTFPITEAQFLGSYFETLTYGIYLVTCGLCARHLFWIPTARGEGRLRRRSEIQWIMISVFCFLFVVQTFDDVIGLWHNLVAFVKYKGPEEQTQELIDVHGWMNIARSFTQATSMMVGDFVLIYRCFIVHGRRWLVIIPSFILFLAGIGIAIKLIHIEITSNAATTLNSHVITQWWSAFFAITAAQNVLTTSLLVWRIWRVEHQLAKYRGTGGQSASITSLPQPRPRKVICIVTESGLAYSTLVFMNFVVSVPMADVVSKIPSHQSTHC